MTRMEATRQFLMPALAQPRLKAHGKNVQGTFSAFEYIPSRYSLADELASKERVASETVRLTVGSVFLLCFLIICPYTSNKTTHSML